VQRKFFLANCSIQAFKSCLAVLLFTCCACTFQGKVLAKFGTFNTCNLILPHFIQRCYLGCTNLNNSENYFNAATSTKMLCMMQNTLTVLRIISTLQPPHCMKRKITCVVLFVEGPNRSHFFSFWHLLLNHSLHIYLSFCDICLSYIWTQK
jgi:hypothetical protein